MTPREPDRYDKIARERAEALFVRVMGTMTSNKCIDLIHAALCREREAALNEAARDAETYCPLNASVSALVLAREIAVHIRALASPAAAPAAEGPAGSRCDAEIAVRGQVTEHRHVCIRPAGHTGLHSEMSLEPAPLLPRVLAALEEARRQPLADSKYASLAAELRAYIADGEGKK